MSRKGDREDERFHSPREQAERAVSLVEARGYVPGPTFEDIDVSGAMAPAERPAMGELLREIEAGRLGGVAAFSLDRLSREPSHGDALVKRVTKAGGVILTPDIPEAIDSPTGEFTFGMLLQVAKLYRSLSGARFASAKERAILAGIPVGPVPVGYRQKPDRTLEPDPVLAPVIRELYERRARGEGFGGLTRRLDEATGRLWSRQAMRAILSNRLYATGRLRYGATEAEVAAGAIVDEPLWQAAQIPTTRRPPRDPTGRWLLSGLLKCAACGNNLAPWSASRSDKGTRRYRCQNRACPARAAIRADIIESWAVLQAFRAGDEMLRRSEEPDLGGLEEAVAVAERRLAQVLAPEARDALGDLWAADVKDRRAELDSAQARLGEARQAAGLAALAADFRLREVWGDLSQLDRREALALFWKEIRVERKKDGGIPVTLVARGPQAEASVVLPSKEGSDVQEIE